MDILDERRYGVVASTTQTLDVTDIGTDTVLVAEALAFESDAESGGVRSYVVLPDPDASHFIVHFGWSSNGSASSGEMFLHDGDGVPKGQRVYFGASSGDTIPMHIECAKGAPIYVRLVALGAGTVSVYVKSYVKRDGHAQHATAFQEV